MPVSTGKLLVGSPRSECPKCKEVFSTPSNWEKHRLPPKKGSRPCMPPEDFEKAGLVLGKTGVWISMQDRFKDNPEEDE